jgi:hypothetical protein
MGEAFDVPVLTESGRWIEDAAFQPDFAFFAGLYSPYYVEVIRHAARTLLGGQLFVSRLSCWLIALPFVNIPPDDWVATLPVALGFIPYVIEIPEVGSVDGFLVSTPAMVAYATYSANGGVDNPADYRRDAAGVWRRGH